MPNVNELTPLTMAQVYTAIESRLAHIEAEAKNDRTGNAASTVANAIIMDELAKLANELERSLDGGCSVTRRSGIHLVQRADIDDSGFHEEVVRRMRG